MFKKKYLPWLMLALPLCFFAFQFILRLFPGLVVPEILGKYNIEATSFGIFAAMYYLGYAPMQIPIAILLDKFGPKWVIALSALACGLASMVLVVSDSWAVALASRFVIGAGSVVGFLGFSKIVSMWFPKEMYGKLVGFSFSFGLLGAIYGGRPVSMMIEQMGWEKVLIILAGVSMLIGLLIFCIVKNSSAETQEIESSVPVLQSLKTLLTNRSILVLAISNFLMVGALEGFADVWGVPFLVATKGIERVDAAGITSMVFVGMIFGGPLLALIADRLNAYRFTISACGYLMAGIFMALFLCHAYLSLSMIAAMMFVVGILCCYQVLVFTVGSQTVSASLLGITVATLNCINMLGGCFFHTCIGWLMDYFWDGTLLNGTKVYQPETYLAALWIIPLAGIFGASMLLIQSLKEPAAQMQEQGV